MNRTAHGGKTIYGARVGIVVLDTRFPRIPGTWPTRRRGLSRCCSGWCAGATVQKIVLEHGSGLSADVLQAAKELVRDGADGIATTGGFMGVFQKELAEHCGVPVATSSVMQVPWVQSLLPPGKRVECRDGTRVRNLDERHLRACESRPRIHRSSVQRTALSSRECSSVTSWISTSRRWRAMCSKGGRQAHAVTR